MGFEIVWTAKAIATFNKRIVYLEKHWTEREIFNFTGRVNEYLELLQTQPLMFRQSARLKNAFVGVIIKEVSVIYRVKSKNNIIELIAFIDNRQSPKKNRA